MRGIFLLSTLVSVASCAPADPSELQDVATTTQNIAVYVKDSTDQSALYFAFLDTAGNLTIKSENLEIAVLKMEKKLGNRQVYRTLNPVNLSEGFTLTMEIDGVGATTETVKFAKPVEPILGESIPEFGKDETRKLTVLAGASDGLAKPRDLEFNPEKPDELWVVNTDTESATIFSKTTTKKLTAVTKKDAHAEHFMAKVSSLAFGSNSTFATCQESRNEARAAKDFMGPTLWPSSLSIFASVNQTGAGVCDGTVQTGNEKILQGSHLDMLHQSPLCMGIAHASGNAYWTVDGYAGNLVYYDFVKDHGPGGDDHSDGRVRRFPEVKLSRTAGVPSHMEVHKESNALFIADSGSGRILKVLTQAAVARGNLQPKGESLAQYASYTGAEVSAFATGLRQPSGIALTKDRLFVSDYATGEIIAYSITSGKRLGSINTNAQAIMGLAISPQGKLWYVDAGANQLVRIDP